MADATGHMDRPGAGPTSAMIVMQGIPTNCYYNFNNKTGRHEVAHGMPPGTPDELVKDFSTVEELRAWVNDEWERRGQLY